MNENDSTTTSIENDVLDFEALFQEEQPEKPKYNPKKIPKHAASIAIYFVRDFLAVLIALGLLLIPIFVKNFTNEEVVVREVGLTMNAIGFIDTDIPKRSEYEKSVIFMDETYVIGGVEHYVLLNPYNLTIFNTDGKIDVSNALIASILNGTVTKWGTNGSDIVILVFENSHADVNISLDNVLRVKQYGFGNIMSFTNVGMGLFQLLVLFVPLIPIFFLMKQDLYEDLDVFKKPDERRKLFGNVATGVLYAFAVTIVINLFTTFISGFLPGTQSTSENQLFINFYFYGSGLVLMLASLVIFAPIIEELVFRKGVFGIFKNDKLGLVISSLVFGLIHVQSEIFSGDWVNVLVNGISYIGMGFVFGWLYLKNKKNIYPVIFIHAGFNLVQAILMLITL